MDTSGTPTPTTGPGSPADRRGDARTSVPVGPERLTGAGTVYFGRVFPAVWTTAVGAFTVAAWLDLLGGPTPPAVKWAMASLWVAVSAVIIRYFGKLRDVWRIGDELIVGDPRRGLRIHLRDVLEIKESRFQQIKTVTLKLRRPTEAGDSISFVPKGVGPFFFPLMTSSVAERLRERHGELMADEHRLIGKR